MIVFLEARTRHPSVDMGFAAICDVGGLLSTNSWASESRESGGPASEHCQPLTLDIRCVQVVAGESARPAV